MPRGDRTGSAGQDPGTGKGLGRSGGKGRMGDPVIARSINSDYNLGGIVVDKSTKERQE